MKNMFYSLLIGGLCVAHASYASEVAAKPVVENTCSTFSKCLTNSKDFVVNSASSVVSSIKEHPGRAALALICLGVISKLAYDYLQEEDDAACCGSICNMPSKK